MTDLPTDIENQTPRVSSHQLHEDINPDEWTEQIETLIARWKNQVDKLSHVHQESGYIVKTRFYRLMIPSIIIPFIMTLVSQNLYQGTNDSAHIIDGVMFMLTSALSSLVMFFSYGQLYEQHFQFSARYSDLVTRIDSELARRRKFRTPSDVFITEIKCRIENLNDSAPEIPGHWC